MKWLSQNWFKLALVVILISGLYIFRSQTKTDNMPVLESEKGASQGPNAEFVANFEKERGSKATIAELSCLTTSRIDCTSEGCSASQPSSYFFVDHGSEKGTYFRCDSKGCDDYPVKVVQSGDFTQFTPEEGQAMFFKVSNSENTLGSKGQFLDIATIGLSSIISSGACMQNN